MLNKSTDIVYTSISATQLTNNNSSASLLDLLRGIIPNGQEIGEGQRGRDQLPFLLEIQIIQAVTPGGRHDGHRLHFLLAAVALLVHGRRVRGDVHISDADGHHTTYEKK